MYQSFFGLNKEPFAMTPDPAFLFLTAAHREALAGLSYAVLGGKGFVVLTGEAGTGKTTLLTKMVRSIPASRATFSVILNPTLSPDEFLELALLDFGMAEVPASKAQRLLLLREFLAQTRRDGKSAVLVVDEAHKLAPEVLEEIRLLSNFELADAKLLQIVMAGQSELANVLNRDDLRQLKQRVAVRLNLQTLSIGDVEQYIHFRWTKAGGAAPHPFNAQAVSQIAEWSTGIPRLVNVICDNALMIAFGEGVSIVTPSQVAEVAADLDLRAPTVRRGRKPMSVEAMTGPRREIANAAGSSAANTAGAAAAAPPVSTFPTIERYSAETPKPSRLTRLAAKLGIGEARTNRYEQNI
jgi:general secretion pathway protein A